MAHKITDACTLCGKCQEVCPEDAIKQGETQYEIDPAKCTDCNLCVPVCEFAAILPPEGKAIEEENSN